MADVTEGDPTAMSRRRPITAEDLVSCPVLSDPQVSPDGTHVALVAGEASREGPFFKSAIWLASVHGNEPSRQFTQSHGRDTAPRWSPDGSSLAFLSDRQEPGRLQPYRIGATCGEAEALAGCPGEFTSIDWSSSGAMLAAIVTEPSTSVAEGDAGNRNDALLFGGDWRFADLWLIDVATNTATRLSVEHRHAVSLSWSPDGRHIALLSQDAPWPDADYSHSRIEVYSVDGGAPAYLCEVSGAATNLCWSPDGNLLAFRGPLGRIKTDDGIYVVPAVGGEPRQITGGYAGAVQCIAWDVDSASLLAAAVEHEASTLLRFALDGSRPEPLLPMTLRGSGYFGRDVSFSAGRDIVGLIRSSGDQPGELWVGAIAAIAQRSAVLARVANWATGHVEPVRWTGADGWEISGLLIHPAGYQPGSRYPLVLHIHGGPSWFWSDHFHADWHDWGQFLASHGYAVLLPNPRGSTGRGAEFAESTYDDYGGKELEDSVRGVDAMIERGIADAERLGVGGWSHGGYMTAQAITRTNRFKAAVMGAGMCNLVSDQGQNDIPRCNDQYFSKRTYEAPDFFMERSPISLVQQVSTPLLIVHGGADDRVHPMQGREFYIALRLLGRTVEHVTYPREKHQFEERLHQADLLRRVLGWFDKYLK
jgi:dipeptidyl aminopeptidase/acylaminoacyl peptidase